MWFYNRLSQSCGVKTAQVALTIYYALIFAIVLVFAYEPAAPFKYAQL